MEVVGLAYADASALPDHLSQVLAIGRAFGEVVATFEPDVVGIELPIPGGSYGTGAKILQARMFQHLVDRSGNLYYRGYSEIAPATSRAEVLLKGDRAKGRTKERIVARVQERTGLDLYGITRGMKGQRLVVESLADAVTVAMALASRVRREGGGG